MRSSARSPLGFLVSSSLVALSLLGGAGCSSQDSGGNGSGGGSPTGTGGAKTGTGGATTGTGGAPSSTGGSSTGGMTAGSGGVMTGAGGSASGGSGSGASVGSGGAPATGTGGASGKGGGSATGGAQAGATGSPGGRDAGATAGRAGGGTSGGSGGAAGGSNGAGGSSAGGGGPSAGCGKGTTRPDRKTQQTMTIAGTTRYYLLNVPSGADSTPLPLVFALHGYDMNNIALVDLYDFTAQSGNKAITVLPQGEGPAPGTTSHWGDQVLKSTWTANAANYEFIQTLKADIQSKYCVDTGRVYISGFSMGGLFTNSTACDHVDWFRGFAPVEGAGPSSCANADAKPSIMIHQGTADTIAKPMAGEATRDFWTMQNGCTTTTSAAYTGCLSYGGCAKPVLYCTGNWDHTVSSTARANVWKFFDSLK